VRAPDEEVFVRALTVMSCRDTPISNRPDREDFERRLNAKLEERRAREAERGPTGWSIGLRYGSEFAGGVLAGAGLGYLADRFLGWSPWGLLVGVILGFAAGTLNVVRAAQSVNNQDGAE
jgi:ATP synthase protein I